MKTNPSHYRPGLLVCTLLLACGLAGCDGESAAATPSPTTPQPNTPVPSPETPAPGTSDFFLGVQTHFGQGWNTTIVPRLTAGNISSVRDELYWQIVEPGAGNFSFPAAYDDYMAALKNNNISPLIELTFENTNYDGGQTPYTDAGFAGYARYATAVLRRYPQIGMLEIWNEYNGTFNKGPATLDRAGTYLEMLRAATAAIREVRPDVTIVGGATAGVPLPYLEKLFADGALDHLDAVSVHPYRSYDPPEGLELQIVALQNLIARYNRGATKPVWVTEYGWGTRPAAAPGDLNIDEATQAKFLVRAGALFASVGVERVYWYLFRDDVENPTMGLVKNDAALTPKPAYTALKVLNARLRGASFIAREKTGPGVYSLHFRNVNGQDLRILWSLTPFSVAVPGGTGVVDLFGSTVATSSLTVTDSPLYVTGPLPALAGVNTARTTTPLADSAAGFSNQQGGLGWHYGVFLGDSTVFQPLPGVRVTDWKEEWTGLYGSISITDIDQHPSRTENTPVSAVRRWVSNHSGPVHLAGRFRLLSTQGDGVRVRVLIDGQTVYAANLGTSTSIVGTFDFQHALRSGSTVDFAVDPGAAGNIGFDSTLVTAAIETAQP